MKQSCTRDVVLSDKRTVRVRCWPGEGTPLVLLHGFCDSSEGWEPLARTSKHPALAFHLPGFGGSDRASSPRIDSFAQRIEAALDELEVARAIVVGHSLGGAVAMSLANRIPERVASLVLLAPAGFGWIPAADLGRLGLTRTLAGIALPHLLGNALACSAAYTITVSHLRRPSRVMIERLCQAAPTLRPGMTDSLAALAALNRERFVHTPETYQGPVYAAWGARDLLVPPRHMDSVRRVLPQAELELWRAVGHYPQLEAPRRLARLIRTACLASERRCLPMRSSHPGNELAA